MQKLVFFALLVLVSPIVLLAQSNDIGVFASTASYPSAHFTDPGMPGHHLEAEFERSAGFGLRYNRYWTPEISTELAFISLSGDRTLAMSDGTSGAVVESGEAEFRVASAVAAWHFRNRGPFAPYLGAGIARIDGELQTGHENHGAPARSLEGESTWIANAGVAYAVTPAVSVAIDVRYIPYQAKIDGSEGGGDGLDIDPLVLSSGILLRF